MYYLISPIHLILCNSHETEPNSTLKYCLISSQNCIVYRNIKQWLTCGLKLMTLLMNQLIFNIRKRIKSATPFCIDFIQKVLWVLPPGLPSSLSLEHARGAHNSVQTPSCDCFILPHILSLCILMFE